MRHFVLRKDQASKRTALVWQHNCMATYSLMEMSISITTQSLQLPLTEKSNITGQRMITSLWHFETNPKEYTAEIKCYIENVYVGFKMF